MKGRRKGRRYIVSPTGCDAFMRETALESWHHGRTSFLPSRGTDLFLRRVSGEQRRPCGFAQQRFGQCLLPVRADSAVVFDYRWIHRDGHVFNFCVHILQCPALEKAVTWSAGGYGEKEEEKEGKD